MSFILLFVNEIVKFILINYLLSLYGVGQSLVVGGEIVLPGYKKNFQPQHGNIFLRSTKKGVALHSWHKE